MQPPHACSAARCGCAEGVRWPLDPPGSIVRDHRRRLLYARPEPQLPGVPHVDPDGRRAEPARRTRVRHLFAPAQGTHRPARLADRRRRREPDHRAAPLPGGRGSREADPPLHQLTRGVRHGRARHLRYDAVRASRDCDAVHRTGSFDGRLAARRRDTRAAVGASQLQGDDPPAHGRVSGTGDGRRYPGSGDPEAATAG